MSIEKFCVFLEFNEKFHTFNHDLTIEKLENYGVRGIIVSWFCSDFLNRQQTVFIKGAFSGFSSIIGPLLFIIYTNDSFKYLQIF